MNNSIADLDAMRFVGNANHEHRKIVLERITAAIEAEKRAKNKPRKSKPQTPYKGSWAESMSH